MIVLKIQINFARISPTYVRHYYKFILKEKGYTDV